MSTFVQNTFSGGMNLLACDTKLQPNEYRIGFDVRNRYGNLEGVLESQEDVAAPLGIKQELVTFGNYVILFVAGKAYYRYFSATGWKQIVSFQMSSTAPRFWTKAVPLATTNYGRKAVPTVPAGSVPSAGNGILLNGVASAFAGNTPGLLVQDNINQPQFIFVNAQGVPTVRTTQNYDQWDVDYVDFVITDDKREYVPIGNVMEWVDGVLYIASQDGNFIYRSVSGRPLDFVVNVDLDGDKGGDATTTSYSVGVGGITCLRAMANDSLLVTASNAVFAVTKNTSAGAQTIFGEYTFIRTFLFNATCLSDRVIIDSLGDTKFISLTGVRSFNSVLQQQNEGRNSLFSKPLQSVFGNVIQDAAAAAAILYDNYELYAINTTFGAAIAVYDTLVGCWTSFDVRQTGGKLVKMLAKIELTIQRLYAVTEDDKLYALYIGPELTTSKVRPASAYAGNVTEGNEPVNSDTELKLSSVRLVFDNIVDDVDIRVTPFVNNRLTQSGTQTKDITYSPPATPYTGSDALPDVDTMLNNAYFSFPNTQLGWKCFCLIEWQGAPALTQLSMSFVNQSPMNSLQSQ